MPREDTFHKILLGLRRNKRQAQQDFGQAFSQRRPEEPRGRWNLRLFGKDVHYGGFDGLGQLAAGAIDASAGVDLARSSVFLDGGIVLPTAAGIPLSVAVNGTYSARITSALDAPDPAEYFRTGDAEARLALYPSASVEVVGHMGVDAGAGAARTGLRSVSRIHSSTFADASVSVRAYGNSVTAAVHMPK